MSIDLRARRAREVAQQLGRGKTYIVVGYRGLKSNQSMDLRSILRGKKARMSVVKNTAAMRALQEAGCGSLAAYIQGPTAVIYGDDDAAQLSKALLAWQDANNKVLEIRAALVGGKVFSAAQVVALSKLPGREQLLAQFVGTLQAPSGAFVRTLHAVIQKFVGTLDAVKAKLPAQG